MADRAIPSRSTGSSGPTEWSSPRRRDGAFAFARRLDIRALRTLFGFTPAEARLVNLLVGGRSLPRIAQELGISFENARTHLARARAKTETVSQVDLVRTVLLALSPLRTAAP